MYFLLEIRKGYKSYIIILRKNGIMTGYDKVTGFLHFTAAVSSFIKTIVLLYEWVYNKREN